MKEGAWTEGRKEKREEKVDEVQRQRIRKRKLWKDKNGKKRGRERLIDEERYLEGKGKEGRRYPIRTNK